MAANRIFFDSASEILFGKLQCSPLKAETNVWTLSQLLMKKITMFQNCLISLRLDPDSGELSLGTDPAGAEGSV
jgi:hypothetical protein